MNKERQRVGDQEWKAFIMQKVGSFMWNEDRKVIAEARRRVTLPVWEHYVEFVKADTKTISTDFFLDYDKFSLPYEENTTIRPYRFHCRCKMFLLYHPEPGNCDESDENKHLHIAMVPWGRQKEDARPRMCPYAYMRPTLRPCDNLVKEYPTRAWALTKTEHISRYRMPLVRRCITCENKAVTEELAPVLEERNEKREQLAKLQEELASKEAGNNKAAFEEANKEQMRELEAAITQLTLTLDSEIGFWHTAPGPDPTTLIVTPTAHQYEHYRDGAVFVMPNNGVFLPKMHLDPNFLLGCVEECQSGFCPATQSIKIAPESVLQQIHAIMEGILEPEQRLITRGGDAFLPHPGDEALEEVREVIAEGLTQWNPRYSAF